MSTPDTTLEAAAARICARQQVRWAPGVTLHTCMLNAATQLSSAPRHPVPCPAVAAWHKPASYFWRSADSRPSGPVAHSATTPDPEQKRADCNRRPRLPAARPGPASADAAPSPTAPSRARRTECRPAAACPKPEPRPDKQNDCILRARLPPRRHTENCTVAKAHTRQPQAPTVTQFPTHAVQAPHALARPRPKNSAKTPPACLMRSVLAGAPVRVQGRRPRARTRLRAITISDV